jgi:hypothetical protein
MLLIGVPLPVFSIIVEFMVAFPAALLKSKEVPVDSTAGKLPDGLAWLPPPVLHWTKWLWLGRLATNTLVVSLPLDWPIT